MAGGAIYDNLADILECPTCSKCPACLQFYLPGETHNCRYLRQDHFAKEFLLVYKCVRCNKAFSGLSNVGMHNVSFFLIHFYICDFVPKYIPSSFSALYFSDAPSASSTRASSGATAGTRAAAPPDWVSRTPTCSTTSGLAQVKNTRYWRI
jgi:hypothetical protein